MHAAACPFPPRTAEYEAWWEYYFTEIGIPNTIRRLDRQRLRMMELCLRLHGHVFKPETKRCRCGVSKLDYNDTPPLQRTMCQDGAVKV